MSAEVPPFANHLPVRVRFGVGVAAQLANVLTQDGARRAFLVIDEGLEEMLPSAANALARAEERGIALIRHVKIRGEPTMETADAACEALAASRCDIVVAIGGGSVLDTAKVARLCEPRGTTLSRLLADGIDYAGPLVPLVCLPTTAGTGSEVSGGAVITDSATTMKTGIANPTLRAQHALVDPAFTYGLPPTVTAHTGADALAQAIAAIVAKTRTPIGNGVALEAIQLAARALVACYRNGNDTAARTEMACASLMAGLAMNISDCAAEHALAQALGGMFHLPHGLCVALVLAETLDRERHYVPGLLDRVADAMGAPSGCSDGTRAAAAIRRLLAELEIPTLRDLGVREGDVDELTDRALADFFIGQSPRPWTRDEVRAAFESALAMPGRSEHRSPLVTGA